MKKENVVYMYNGINEISQRKKILHDLIYVWNLKKKQKQTHRHKKHWWLLGGMWEKGVKRVKVTNFQV